MIKHLNYLIYQETDSNLILSAPHCGSLYPTSIPDRTWGVTVRDTYTKTIIKGLLDYFQYEPSFIYSGIHRVKVDLNRAMEEAAQGNKKAELIWHTWNDVLDYFLLKSTERGKALYIDIHSHNNSDKIQLGYSVDKFSYEVLRKGGKITALTSLDGLGHPNYDMMFGSKSLKGLLESRGRAVYNPSPKEQYFDGGYNTYRHKQVNLGVIQVEVPVSICENGTDGVIEDLGYAISKFKKVFVDGYSSDTLKY